jgi:hypothetical protein
MVRRDAASVKHFHIGKADLSRGGEARSAERATLAAIARRCLLLECLRSGLEIQVEDLVATLNRMIHAGISREAANHGTSRAHPKTSTTPIRVIDVLRARLQGLRKASTSQIIP